jgi:pimeloyl-ACP methyl ester carboxylesterase
MEYSMTLFADDMAKLMDHVGFQSAHIFGISLGGMIAQEFAIRYPLKTRSIILGCTLPGGWSHAVRVEHSADVMIAFSSDETIAPEVRARALARVAFMSGYSEKHPEIIKILIAQRKEKPIDKIGVTRRLETVGKYNAYDQLSKITCSTLVITGKNDQLVAWENASLIAKKIPNAKLVTLENAGHLFWVEQKKKALAEIFLFINKGKEK